MSSAINRDKEEPLLNDNRKALTFPLRYPSLYELFKVHQAQFWTISAVRVSDDITDWKFRLNKDEQFFIKNILAFFAASDAIVMDNITDHFMKEIQAPEAKHFYAFQAGIEAIHSETYAKLIDVLIEEPDEKARLFNAIEEIEAVKDKAQWAQRWSNSDRPIAERIIAYIIIEGLFFSGAFCSIFWLKKRGLMLNGLCKSNDLISKDEGLHVDFGIILYRLLKFPLPSGRVHEIFREAIPIEKKFICESLPCKLIGMNSDMMCQYIEFVADFLLTQLKLPKLYNATNPFQFMELISLEGKVNFFEEENADYQISGSTARKKEDFDFATDADF